LLMLVYPAVEVSVNQQEASHIAIANLKLRLVRVNLNLKLNLNISSCDPFRIQPMAPDIGNIFRHDAAGDLSVQNQETFISAPIITRSPSCAILKRAGKIPTASALDFSRLRSGSPEKSALFSPTDVPQQPSSLDLITHRADGLLVARIPQDKLAPACRDGRTFQLSGSDGRHSLIYDSDASRRKYQNQPLYHADLA